MGGGGIGGQCPSPLTDFVFALLISRESEFLFEYESREGWNSLDINEKESENRQQILVRFDGS